MSSAEAACEVLGLITSPLMHDEWRTGQPHFGKIIDRRGWSSGEWVLIEVALAIWNGSTTARVSSLLALEDRLLGQVLGIISEMRPGVQTYLERL